MEQNLSLPQKKANTDLNIIIFTMIIVTIIYTSSKTQIILFLNNTTIPILLRTVVSSLIQFGIAGLGISIVAILRKEHFSSYNLKLKGTLKSIILCSVCFVPYIIFGFITNQITNYLPFSTVWITKEVLNSSFPTNIIGMSLIMIAWGFFEGFNYVFISHKINIRYPSKNKWLNWGAITCAILCIIIHGLVGVSLNNFIEMITIFIIIYGMLMVKEFTGNAWGCIFIFIFLWNAF